MSLNGHNQSQACQVQSLIEREAWYLSEQLGYDCTTTAEGICKLNNRVANIICDGFGEWMATLKETEEI
ncbi:hypothetical protein P8625_51 [Verrucomicrobia phage P8625]|uniref:hypothetical protein n=1 Tax=Verrucomicrobia phage P8625 TaxID=1636271 RepID=UPI0005FEB3DA|nr:hypothetical protein AWI59_gp51 [Verrucomicrobia phage P8625]AKA60302.1 hypothetical protein P8625_51 [Verrucomicrobia phage P8625]